MELFALGVEGADNPRKFEKAQYILLNKEIQGYTRLTCSRVGEAVPWGFRQNRYFIQFVERIGGG